MQRLSSRLTLYIVGGNRPEIIEARISVAAPCWHSVRTISLGVLALAASLEAFPGKYSLQQDGLNAFTPATTVSSAVRHAAFVTVKLRSSGARSGNAGEWANVARALHGDVRRGGAPQRIHRLQDERRRFHRVAQDAAWEV